jgi:hypothetical protein
MSRKQLGIVAIVLFVLLGVAYLVSPKKKSDTPAKATYTNNSYSLDPTQPIKQTAKTRAEDKKKRENLEQVLTIIANTYSRDNKEYPAGTAAGWKEIKNTVPLTEAFIDPASRTFYEFSSGQDPDYGEVQYKPKAACKGNQFTSASYRSIALRARLISGVICLSLDSTNNLNF